MNRPSWIFASQVNEPGDYWCRPGPHDEEPSVVRIIEEKGLVVEEHGQKRWLNHAWRGYGANWQYLRFNELGEKIDALRLSHPTATNQPHGAKSP